VAPLFTLFYWHRPACGFALLCAFFFRPRRAFSLSGKRKPFLISPNPFFFPEDEGREGIFLTFLPPSFPVQQVELLSGSKLPLLRMFLPTFSHPDMIFASFFPLPWTPPVATNIFFFFFPEMALGFVFFLLSPLWPDRQEIYRN